MNYKYDSERDYEKDPIVLRATIEVYIYEPIENLKERVEHFNRRKDVMEAALLLVGQYFTDDCGLNECNVEIVE